MYEYDALNRLIRQTDPLNGVTEHFYGPAGNLIQTIDPIGGTITNTYDALNRLETVTDALGNVTTYEYDVAGRQAAITDANGHRTEYSYDVLGRQVSTTDVLGHVESTQYDALGNVTSRTDASGKTTLYFYNDLNQLARQVDALNGETLFTYDAAGNQLTVTDPNGHTTTTECDALNRVISVTDANGNQVTTVYDAAGNRIETTEGSGQTTHFDYDALNRLIKTTDPLGHATQYGYDGNGNRISMTAANGVVTRYEYDLLNRLVAVVENYLEGEPADVQTNVRTEYTYDVNGNRLSIEDANGHIRMFTYDALNRLLTESDPLGNTTTYDYDAVGNRVSQLDANGATTTYTYNAINQVTAIDYPDPDSDVTFTYDASGRRAAMTDGSGDTTWTSDDLGRTTGITDGTGNTVSYAYDPAGNRTSLTYPDNQLVQYTLDQGGRMQLVTAWDNLTTAYTYNPAGQIQTVTLPNQVQTTYDFDADGRIENISHEREGTVLSQYHYTYDSNGNRTSVVEKHTNGRDDLISKDDFETEQLTDWTLTPPDSAAVHITPRAALHGGYGMQLSSEDGQPVYVSDTRPEQETHYRARFYFDPNAIWMAEGEYLTLFEGVGEGSLFKVVLLFHGASYTLKGSVQINDASWQDTAVIFLSRQEHMIELDWQAGSQTGVADGHFSIWLDGEKQESLTDLDNSGQMIETARLGIIQASSSVIFGTMLFDGFESRRGSYIGEIIDPDIVFKDSFESGDLSAWSQWEDADDDLEVTSTAALVGWEGLQVTIDDDQPAYVEDQTPENYSHYWSRFYFDPSSIQMADGEQLDLLQVLDAEGRIAARLELGQTGSQYQVRARAIDDDGLWTNTDWTAISDDAHLLEMTWWGSWWDGANNGLILLWVDDERKNEIFGLDNDTYRADTTRLGAVDEIDAGTQGALLFDAFRSSQETYNGMEPQGKLPQTMQDGFETQNFWGWTYIQSDPADVHITTMAAMAGSYGMQVDLNDNGDWYLLKHILNQPTTYQAQFSFDPNGISMAEGDAHFLLYGFRHSYEGAFVIELTRWEEQYWLRAVAIDNAEDWISTNWVAVEDSPHTLAIDWRAATSSIIQDGELHFTIDGQVVGDLYGINNSSRWVDMLWFGPFGIEDGTRGTEYFDNFVGTSGVDALARLEQDAPAVTREGQTDRRPTVPMTETDSGEQPPLTPGKLPAIPNGPEQSQPWKGLYWQAPDPTIKAPPVQRMTQPVQRIAQVESLVGEVTIDYTYDPLGRLTGALYSDGTSFAYGYDAVGNRLWEETNEGRTCYRYDDANRLERVWQKEVGEECGSGDGLGVAYAWDANGNLLSDGIMSYQYDHANRLVQVTQGEDVTTFVYNGLGERVRQVVNGVATDFTLDQAAGLSQVLTDGTQTYLYGNGRIAQYSPSRTDYFLTDALGSVRQLVDGAGNLNLIRHYAPYGQTLASAGEGETDYGFTGEWTSSYIKLLYLRSRYYSSYLNQFIQPDPILPANGNRYSYVGNNPINYVDPTGMYRWRFSSDPIYHQAIENEYASRGFGIMGLFLNPNKQLEYTIPGVGKRPDMFNSLTGDVFEIEPISNIPAGQIQLLDYVALLQLNRGSLHGTYLGQIPYDWTSTNFHIGLQSEWGEKYRKHPLNLILYPYLDLVADYNSQGVIAYWLEFNDFLPILLPQLAAKKAKTPNDKLIMPRKFYPQPGLAYYGPGEYSEILNLGPSDCMKTLFVSVAYQGLKVYQVINDPIRIGIPDGIIRSPDNRGVYFISIELSLAYFLPLLALAP